MELSFVTPVAKYRQTDCCNVSNEYFEHTGLPFIFSSVQNRRPRIVSQSRHQIRGWSYREVYWNANWEAGWSIAQTGIVKFVKVEPVLAAETRNYLSKFARHFAGKRRHVLVCCMHLRGK